MTKVLRLALLRLGRSAGDGPEAGLDAADLDWFAGCKRHHLEALPGAPYELLRLALVLWACKAGPAWFVAANGLTCLALIAALARLRHMQSGNRVALTHWQRYVLVRAVAMAGLAAAAVAVAPAPHLVPLVLVLQMAYGVEAYAQFPLPGAAMTSQVLGMLALVGMLATRNDVDVPLIGAIGLLQVFGARVLIHHLYYLFATRRLRTRKLTVANDTIRLLLHQYDEHGSDCLVECDSAVRIGNASDRLCRMAGRGAEDLDGRSLIDLFEPGRGRDAIRNAIAQMAPFRDIRCTLASPEGLRWWLASGCAVYDAAGRHTGFRFFIRDITDRHTVESRVRFLATHDGLTRMPNRVEFQSRLDVMMRRFRYHRRNGAGLSQPARTGPAVLFIDLDRFKLVNDSAGHGAGDVVLAEAAARLAHVIGEHGMVARLGGDEFGVLLRSAASEDELVATGEAIVGTLSVPFQLEDRIVRVGASVGIAIAGVHGNDGGELLRAADLAQYEAKSGGGGSVVVYNSDIRRERAGRLRLQAELRLALAQGQFVLHYQPVVDLAGGATVAYEALIRWQHPERGLLEPGHFIALAEESGLIVPIGEWVLREATAQAAKWPAGVNVAVNVSATQLHGGEVVRQVIAALSASGLDPTRLDLEITETVLIDNEAASLDGLRRLRNLGVRISLDDFGVGYSSLNYLRSFPFDTIKIDRCFVLDLLKGCDCDVPRGSTAIIRAVLELARQLGMATIAEGVEEPRQMECLRLLGCDRVQGYLVGMPQPADTLVVPAQAPGHAAVARLKSA